MKWFVLGALLWVCADVRPAAAQVLGPSEKPEGFLGRPTQYAGWRFRVGPSLSSSFFGVTVGLRGEAWSPGSRLVAGFGVAPEVVPAGAEGGAFVMRVHNYFGKWRGYYGGGGAVLLLKAGSRATGGLSLILAGYRGNRVWIEYGWEFLGNGSGGGGHPDFAIGQRLGIGYQFNLGRPC